jgi:hypothetical protein
MISSPLSVVLTQAEIDRLMVRLFDKDPPTVHPVSVPAPFCSENSPPLVRITIIFVFLLLSRIILFRLQTQGLYPEARINVEVSSGKDDVPRPTASADKLKKSASDDAEDRGVSSAEPIAPNPISSGTSGPSDPSTAAWVVAPVLPSGKHGKKCPLPVARRNKLLDQVMTLVPWM